MRIWYPFVRYYLEDAEGTAEELAEFHKIDLWEATRYYWKFRPEVPDGLRIVPPVERGFYELHPEDTKIGWIGVMILVQELRRRIRTVAEVLEDCREFLWTSGYPIEAIRMGRPSIRAFDPRWRIGTFSFLCTDRRRASAVGRGVEFLNDRGQLIPGIWARGIRPPNLERYKPYDGSAVKEIIATLLRDNAALRFSLGLLNCRNVELIQREESKRLRRRRGQELRELPRLTYKTLAVRPMRPKVQDGGNGEGPQESQGLVPLHFCRGHFKDYRHGKGLFGKYQDQFWWAQQWRGNADRGVVLKDYEIRV